MGFPSQKKTASQKLNYVEYSKNDDLKRSVTPQEWCINLREVVLLSL
jgi:hypothetical protein